MAEAWYDAFVDEGHAPGKNDLVALFRYRPARGVSRQEALGRIASESSVGTWTTLADLPDRIHRLKGIAHRWTDEHVWVSYPKGLWEPGNLPQLLSGIGGNIFGMKAVERLRLEDVSLPAAYRRGFRGPELGIQGLREALQVPERPLTATVPKPKLGFTAAEHAQVAKEAWIGGIDLVKDDENLTSQTFNRFEDRVARMTRRRGQAEEATGDVKSALINVTAETDEARRRMRLLADHGWEYAMVDVVVVGWSGLQSLRETGQELGLAIHAHRAMHAMFTKDPRHGMSMPCLAKLLRLVGVDQLHAGTVVGKLTSPEQEVLATADVLRQRNVAAKEAMLLDQDWGHTRPVFPVASGGLHPGLVPKVLDLFGQDVVVQAGGGVHGHPDGTRAGAEALREVLEAHKEGVAVERAAKGSPALAKALVKWGKTRTR